MRLRDLSPSAAILATLLAIPELATAFYLPGVAPTSYKEGDKVPLHVNHLTAVDSQGDGTLRSVLAFDYYHPAFHFCHPEPKAEYVSESLGSILFGDRIMTSPFELNMHKNETCKVLCKSIYDVASAKWVNQKIAGGWTSSWAVD
jgi:transmembrane 9 superfamily protein 2/4